VAKVATLTEELAAVKEQLAAEQARSKQLQEASAAQQFKFDLLVDMVRIVDPRGNACTCDALTPERPLPWSQYTLQMLDQDLLMDGAAAAPAHA
jgi:hypothetical protein